MILYFGEGMNNFWVSVQKNKAVENFWLLFRLTASRQVIHVSEHCAVLRFKKRGHMVCGISGPTYSG